MTDTQDLTKLTVNLTPLSVEALHEAVLITEDSYDEIVNQALQVYPGVIGTESGKTYMFENFTGESRHLWVVPSRPYPNWLIWTVLSFGASLVLGLAFLAGVVVG